MQRPFDTRSEFIQLPALHPINGKVQVASCFGIFEIGAKENKILRAYARGQQIQQEAVEGKGLVGAGSRMGL